MRYAILVLGLLSGGLSMVEIAEAQPPGRRSEMLRRFDSNGDGKVEQSEIPDRAKPFVQRMVERSGLDPNGTISIEAFAAAEGRESGGERSDRRESGRSDRGGDGRDRRGGDDRRDGGRDRSDWRSRWREREEQRTREPVVDTTKVAGFGTPPAYDPVPGFDVPLSATGSLSNAQLNEIYPSRVMGYVDGRILKEYDKNKNGMLDPSEWNLVSWRSDPHESDQNGDGILTRAELAARIAKRYDVKVEIPADTQRRVVRRSVPSRAAPASRSAGQSSSRGEDEKARRQEETKAKIEANRQDRAISYVKALIKEYDKNKDGALQESEWDGMSSMSKKSDFDGNGVITESELMQKYARQDGSSGSSGNSRRGNRRGRSSESERSAGGEFVRLRMPRERLPDGVPSWFISKDQNQDGQVAMYEYATTWNAKSIEEFDRYDANGDGLITAGESLRD